jgi:hypothetical protein
MNFNQKIDWVLRAQRLRAALLFVIHGGWVVLMLCSIVLKVAEHGVASYVRYFTNWSWTLQALFYASTLGAPLLEHGALATSGAIANSTRAIVALGFFPLNGIVFVVMFVVTVLLGTNSPFLADFIDDLPLPIVLIGNDLFHFWPIVNHLLYAVAYPTVIRTAHAQWLPHGGDRGINVARRLYYIIYQAFIGSAVPLGIYAAIFDPRIVYETSLSLASGLAVVFLALVVFNLVPVIYSVPLRVHR